MTLDMIRDIWPSLTYDDHHQIADQDKEDPDWMADLSPYYRGELREECEKELEMMTREANRQLDDGHPEYVDDYETMYAPNAYGGFDRVIRGEK